MTYNAGAPKARVAGVSTVLAHGSVSPALRSSAPWVKYRQLLYTAALVFTLVIPGAHAANDKARAGPQPAFTLPVEPLGFHPQSAAVLVSRLSTNSLDFIDEDHLLLTFRSMGLLKRDASTRPGEQDQSIHAVVLELPSGKIIRTADWRMHDHGRYLWPMQDGRFLIRQRDTLFMTDASLELRPYLDAPSRLQGVQPSPDGKLLVIQLDKERHSASEHQRLTQQALDADASLPREDVSILIVNAATGAVLGRTDAARPIDLPLMGDGYLETLPSKLDHWLLSYVGLSGEKKVFGDVLSTCAPTEVAATPSISLLITCHAKTDDHLVQGIDAQGKLLWESWWGSAQIWPAFAHSRDGSRLAISHLRATHGVDALDPIGDEDIKGETLQVLDSTSGIVLLNINVTPAVSSSENFALSPDGKKFAVLTAKAIDIYDVPSPVLPAPEPERKK
ncbi:MAG TPA: hypothetical protein VGD64_02780 [Acidisarcina sp.]